MNPTPKIFVFINGANAFGLLGCALAEDGTVVAGHCSSTEGWVRQDMIRSGWKDQNYSAHYPEGYELVDLIEEDPTTNPEFVAAVELAKAKVGV